MPTGVYSRKKKSKKAVVARANRAIKEALGTSVDESEFLTHGSTHARERVIDYDALRHDYERLLTHAVTVAMELVATDLPVSPTALRAVRVIFKMQNDT